MMEAILDHQTDYLNANIRLRSDNDIVLYTLSTVSVPGHRHDIDNTTLTSHKSDAGSPIVLGRIHWRDHTLEMNGQTKHVNEIRPPFSALKRNVWRWEAGSRGYSVKYDDQSKIWKATAVDPDDRIDSSNPAVEFVTYHHAHKTHPAVLRFSPESALDEAFLILVLILTEETHHAHASIGHTILETVKHDVDVNGGVRL